MFTISKHRNRLINEVGSESSFKILWAPIGFGVMEAELRYNTFYSVIVAADFVGHRVTKSYN